MTEEQNMKYERLHAAWDGPMPTRLDIETLMYEAAEEGDEAMYKICEAALEGDKRSLVECALVMDAARAMGD